MSLVYKPLSNTIQWGKLSKDKMSTVGNPIDVTQEALATVVIYLNDNNRKVIVEMDNGVKVELSMQRIKEVTPPPIDLTPDPTDSRS